MNSSLRLIQIMFLLIIGSLSNRISKKSKRITLSSLSSLSSFQSISSSSLSSSSLSSSSSSSSSSISKEDEEASKIAEFITSSSNLIVITGAGISTSSGVPDYRSPNGSYSRGHKPIVHSDFINKESSRKRYWARSMVGWNIFNQAKPNHGHVGLARIESKNINNKFSIITQNVDRLHQKAGSRNVIDLHGRNDKLICLSCNCELSRKIIQKQIELLNPDIANELKTNINHSNLRADGDADLDGIIDYEKFVVPCCPRCGGGILKPKVVFFGDNVNSQVVQDIYKSVDESDALLIVGTSLEVYSAYRFVDRFAKKSNNICILNQGKTRSDANHKLLIRSESNCNTLLKKTADLIDSM